MADITMLMYHQECKRPSHQKLGKCHIKKRLKMHILGKNDERSDSEEKEEISIKYELAVAQVWHICKQYYY